MTFFLEPRLDNTTRLILRTRMEYQPGRLGKTVWGMVEPVTFVMERQLLRGICERAETHRVPDPLLDRAMPEYEFRGVESVLIHASPEQIFEAFSKVSGKDMPLGQLLGQARSMTSQFAGSGQEHAAPDEPFMNLILKMGFVRLGEQSNRQVILGGIAKFHELRDEQLVQVRDAVEFRRFLHADYQKLAISVRVLGDDPVTGCTLILEHRTHAMSEHARKQFARYWLAIKPGGGLISRQLLSAVKSRAEAVAAESSGGAKKVNAPPQAREMKEGTTLPPHFTQKPVPKPELANV
jgi:hypothetical protein